MFVVWWFLTVFVYLELVCCSSDTFILDGYSEVAVVPTQAAVDVHLLVHRLPTKEERWYAVALEDSPGSEVTGPVDGDALVVYKNYNGVFEEIGRLSVLKGIKIVAESYGPISFLMLFSKEKTAWKGSSIFFFDENETLSRIQNLQNFASLKDAIFWENSNEIFLGLITEQNIIIYKWHGSYFDIMQTIEHPKAKKMVSFNYEMVSYLIVLYQNDIGSSNRLAIYVYNFSNESFMLFQSITVREAAGITHFSFKQQLLSELFVCVLLSEGDILMYKLDDDLFVPFQILQNKGISSILPFEGVNGEFVLFATKGQTCVTYQYDGWSFVENIVSKDNALQIEDNTEIKFYQVNNVPVLLIPRYESHAQIIKPEFAHMDLLMLLHEKILNFYENTIQQIKEQDLKSLRIEVDKLPKQTDKEITFEDALILSDASIEHLDTPQILTLNGTDDDTEVKIKTELHWILETQTGQVTKMDDTLQTLFYDANTIILNKNVTIDTLIVENDHTRKNRIENLHVDYINDVHIDTFFDTIIDIEEGFNIETLEISDVKTTSYRFPLIMNGHLSENLFRSMSTTQDIELATTGTVTVDELFIKGSLDGVRVSPSDVVLQNSNQDLNGFLEVDELIVGSLRTSRINNFIVSSGNDDIARLKNVTVKNLIFKSESQINGINLLDVYNRALKVKGNQIITGAYLFEHVQANRVFVSGMMSGKIVPADIVLIDGGNYTILQSMEFTNELIADELIVRDKLNQISVKNGKLDVLLVDEPRLQLIEGTKTFSKVEVKGPIKLRGKIFTKGLDRMNPVIKIEEDLNLIGDFIIKGNVTVENGVTCNNLAETKGKYSIQRLKTQGLALDDTELKVPITIIPQVQAINTEAKVINSINVDSWISVQDPYMHRITGKKRIVKNLTVLGKMVATEINSINVLKLNDSLMKRTGDQTVIGKHTYQNITANRVQGEKIVFDNLPWTEIKTIDSNFTFDELEVFGTLIEIEDLKTEYLQLNWVNKYNFTEMLLDTAFESGLVAFSGVKNFNAGITFQNINYKHLNERDILSILHKHDHPDELTIQGPVSMRQTFRANTINVNGLINNIPAQKFGRDWFLNVENQQFTQDVYFKELTLSDFCPFSMNGASVSDIFNEAISLNDDMYLEHFEFEELFVENVYITQNLNDVNMNDYVKTTMDEIYINGSLKFIGNVTIGGDFQTPGLVSGLNLEQLCKFANTTENIDTHLIINGTVFFDYPPEIEYLNSFNVHEMIDRMWFTDRDMILNGFFTFENVTFHNNLILKGALNNENADIVLKTCLKKNGDQIIPQKVWIEEVVFDSIRAMNLTVIGTLSGINFTNIENKLIINNKDQEINNELELGNITILGELSIDSSINGHFSFENVMRYSTENYVTGTKIVENVIVDNIDLYDGATIQDVDVLDWISQVVVRNEDSKINGLKTFEGKTTFEKALHVDNLVNGIIFDKEHVLLKKGNQILSGEKYFSSEDPGKIYFNSLQTEGQLINGKNVSDILEKIALKNQDMRFETPNTFLAPLFIQNVTFENFLNGVPMKTLEDILVNINKVNEFDDEYQEMISIVDFAASRAKRDNLLQLKHFERIQNISGHTVVANQNSFCVFESNGEETIYYTYSWNDTQSVFTRKGIIKRLQKEEEQIEQILKDLNQKTIKDISCDHRYIFLESIKNLQASENFIKEAYLSKNNEICFNSTEKNTYCSNVCFFDNEKINLSDNSKLFVTKYKDNCFVTNDKNSTILIKRAQDGQKWLQGIPSSGVTSLDGIEFGKDYFLAMRSKNSLITIARFDILNRVFLKIQVLDVPSTVKVKFEETPSQELFLYVLTKNPSDSLLIYKYEGIFMFVEKFKIPVNKEARDFSVVKFDSFHFILLISNNNIDVFQARYLGENV